MKIIVDAMLCEANGVCEGIAPELFRLDDAGRLQIDAAGPLTPEQRARVDRAVRCCPKGALRLVGNGPTDPPERTQP
jgi:ferredoxin